MRRARSHDVDAMAAVHRDAVVTGYAGLVPPEAPAPSVERLCAEWERALGEADATVLVAQAGGHVVGMVMVRPDPDFPGCGQLRRLNIAPTRWGQGIGARLHDEALRLLSEAGFETAGLWVLEGNRRARAMYKRRGWSLVPGATLEWSGLGVVEVRYSRSMR